MKVSKLTKIALIPLIRDADSVAVGLARVRLALLGSIKTAHLVGTFEPQIQSVEVGMDAGIQREQIPKPMDTIYFKEFFCMTSKSEVFENGHS